MKRNICAILMVALLVLPAGPLGIAQEGTPPAPEGWPAMPEQWELTLPQGRDLEGWPEPVPPTGPGAVITVTTADDELNNDGDCSLREAIQAANTNAAVDTCTPGSGADTVLVPAGTYLLTIPGAGENANYTGDLDIYGDLTLTGDGAGLTILDGNSLDRVLDIRPGRIVEINTLTVTHGQVTDAAGGGLRNHGTLTATEVTFRENTVAGTSGSYGGAIMNDAWPGQDASTTLDHCLVISNTAYFGGGILSAAWTAHTASVTLSDTTVRGNTSLEAPAGGLYNGNWSNATDCVSELMLTNSILESNAALGGLGGGGLLSIGDPATNKVAVLTVDRSTIGNNTAVANTAGSGLGGGVLAIATETTIVDSTIHDNEAYCDGFSYCGAGGGAFLWEGTTTVEASTIRDNNATAIGSGTNIGGVGGLLVYEGAATVRNSTVSGNQASGDSGGVQVEGDTLYATLTLENSTVAGNSAGLAGGGVSSINRAMGAAAIFKNSVVAGNSAPANESCYNPDLGYGPGVLDSLGNNLEDYDYCEFDQPTDLPNTDPLLGPLQDNGGPTWTHALLEGSLARDHGDDAACPQADQRGVPRPQGPHCDIGAFEAYADETPPAVMAVSPPDGAVDVALDASLVITFSEPISVPTFAYSVAPNPGGWAGSWGPNDTAVTLTHDPFDGGTVYTATVSAAEDRAGNPLAEAFEWSFATVCEAVQIVTVTPACDGYLVSFSAELSGTPPFDYLWDLGAMGTHTGTNPVVDFGVDGTYPFTLTVTNCGGSFSDTASSEVTVPCLPTFRIYLPLMVRDSG